MNFSHILRKLKLIENIQINIQEDTIELIQNLNSIIQPKSIFYKSNNIHKKSKYTGFVDETKFSLEKRTLSDFPFKISANGEITNVGNNHKLILEFNAFNKIYFVLFIFMYSIFSIVLLAFGVSILKCIFLSVGLIWILFWIIFISLIFKNSFKQEFLNDIGIK